MKLSKDIEWWVKFRSPADIYKNHPSFLKLEYFTYFCALLTLIHALRNGGRYKWLWLGILLHGIVVEIVSYFMPEIDNFWHAQGTVMFVGQRLPFYIVVLYEVFIYTASVAVSHMHLKWWAEPFAAGLTVVAIDIPYDILGVKLLSWTWHDTDPNIFDRMYWAPWTSYYFHAAFTSGFIFAFHGLHRLLGVDTNQFISKGFCKELINTVIAGLFGFPLGTLQFLPNYHILHDKYKLHTEICVLMILTVYAMIVWRGDRIAVRERATQSPGKRKDKYFNEIVLIVIMWYTFWIVEVFVEKPQNIRAYGLHETPGPCNETEAMTAASGQILYKRKYLCLEDYDEGYYDFHCVKKLPAHGESWYTVCGVPFANHLEYIVIICFFCAFGLYWLLTLLLGSGSLPLPRSRSKPIKPKQN